MYYGLLDFCNDRCGIFPKVKLKTYYLLFRYKKEKLISEIYKLVVKKSRWGCDVGVIITWNLSKIDLEYRKSEKKPETHNI